MPEGLPCRLCLHDWPGQKQDGPRPHLDLFVRRAPEASFLETFEVSVDLLDDLESLPVESRQNLTLQIARNSAAYHAVRKADHRLVYWEFAGPIAPAAGQDRGILRELARGTLHGSLALDAAEFYFDWQMPAAFTRDQV